MKELATINNREIAVKMYHGQRVVTFSDIDLVHERPDGTARKRFNDNKKRFVDGSDYFTVTQPSEIRTLGIERPQGGTPESITLITESGYLMLVKSFTDDLAWTVQRQLVNTYFRAGSLITDLERMKVEAQKERSRAMLLNAQNRALKTLMGTIPDKKLSPIAVEVFGLKSIQEVTGVDVGQYLPECRKTYSATEVGKQCGVSAKMVGVLANDNGLKTKEFGIDVLDKARGHDKQVPNFRYYETVIPVLKGILAQTTKI